MKAYVGRRTEDNRAEVRVVDDFDEHELDEWVIERKLSPRAEMNARPLPHIAYHSPTGFEWGYGGSGPADLALAILADYAGYDAEQGYPFGSSLEQPDDAQHRIMRAYQAFKSAHVAEFDHDEWLITEHQIASWLASAEALIS